jgi:hypothetical protein
MKNDVKCTRRKENECAYGHIFLALKTSMSISSDSENIFDFRHFWMIIRDLFFESGSTEATKIKKYCKGMSFIFLIK